MYGVVVLNISYDNKIDTIYGIKVNKYEPSVIVRQLTSIAPLGTPQLPQLAFAAAAAGACVAGYYSLLAFCSFLSTITTSLNML